MDFYLVLKFFHILSAVIWLGGSFTLLLLATVQITKVEPERLLATIGQVAYVGPRLFMPASLATLLTGFGAVYLAGFGWPAWVVLGFAGIVVTAMLGALKLGPMSGKVLQIAQMQGLDEAWPEAIALVRLARFDNVMLFSIVFLMVVKPDWQDLLLLAIPALAVLLGALMVNRPAFTPLSNG